MAVGIAGCLITAIIAVMFGRSLYPSMVADYPESWLKIVPGMTSDDARKLIGKPLADGRDLKVVDRWQHAQNGVELHLDLWFDNDNNGAAAIKRVARWKRFMGLNSEMNVKPPWP